MNKSEADAATKRRLSPEFFLFCLPLTLLAAASILLGGLVHAASKAKMPSTASKIELVYDADKKLCGSLAGLFNRLKREYPKAIYLSEVRTAFFDHTGFDPPSWIVKSESDTKDYGDPSSEVSLFRDQGNGYWTGGAFFRGDVANDSSQRLVLVEHDSFGHSGDYQVTIWILKQGQPYRKISPGHRDTGADSLDPDVVDLVVDFEGARPPYRSIALPRQYIGFSKLSSPSGDAEKLLNSSIRGKQAQEVLLFQGAIYFTIGTPLRNYGLTYRVTPEMTAEIVCMTADRSGLNELKKSPFWK